MQSADAADKRDGMETSDLSPAQEARQVIHIETECHRADTREPAFLVAMSWWNAWTNYSGFSLRGGDTPVVRQREESEFQPPRPQQIDNNNLVIYPNAAEKKLKPGLLEGTDYKLVFESTWKLLHKWYGGETAFVRQWVGDAQPFVEVYALQLTIRRSSDSKEAQLFITREAKKSDLKTKACQLMDLKEEDVRMWDFYMCDLYVNMEDQLDDGVAGPANALNDKQHVLLEEKDAAGNFTFKKKLATITSTPLMLRSGRNFSPPSDTFIDASGRDHGLAGLSNLGNTCFMNSSIQNLAHTVPLMRKFLRKQYESDINKDNPLGMNGEMAQAFGSLMDKLWQGDTASVSPSSFKYQLGKFAPQFQGYGQQDSQELLAFLLDGLHEDLNRIKRKPYVEEKDADGRPDEEVAAEAWQNYRKRNDSTIVDHFQGLYKSTLICPKEDCRYHSIKFDPFMYLSLPLPDKRTRNFEVTVVHVNGSKVPTKYSVAVPITGKVKDLYQAVAKALSLPAGDPQKLLLLAEYDSRQTLSMHSQGSEPLTTVSITNGPGYFHSSKPLLLAYCYPSAAQGPASGKQLLVYHRQRKKHGGINVIYGGGEDFPDKFAPPLVLFMAQEQLQQLHQHTQQLEIADAPSWKHFEYVLESNSGINTMLETALRPFKRPRLNDEEQQHDDASQGRMVRSRIADATSSDIRMADTPAATAASNGNGLVPEGSTTVLSPFNGLHNQQLKGSQHIGEASDNAGKSAAVSKLSGCDHMDAAETLVRSAPAANGHSESHTVPAESGVNGKGADHVHEGLGNGFNADGGSHDQASAAGSLHANGKESPLPATNGQQLASLVLQRMSWMEPEAASANGHADGLTNGTANGEMHANGGMHANGDTDDWEDVPDAGEGRTPSPVMFAMDGDHGDEAGALQCTHAPLRLPLPPGLKIKPVVPPVQPFNMFAGQQAQAPEDDQVEEAEEQTDGQEGGKGAAPYTLKCANHLGDVRLQNCPSPEEQKVLYFTAQWERDGGGVYDVAKFTQPEEDESVRRASGVASTSAREAVGLDACLQAFQTAEELEAEDSWFCSKCKRHVQANKKLDLWAVPEVLVVHLKRFFFTRARRDKLDVQVDFPLEDWDLSDYLPHHQDVPPVYDLYAVSNHFGGMGGGHYNAYCKMPDGKWWCFDDSHVHAVEKDQICSSSAYVLFYRRRHDAQQDAGDLLADIMKSRPEDADTVMADAGDENRFQQGGDGDSPEWTNRPLIQATQLHPAEDTATHDINNDDADSGELRGGSWGGASTMNQGLSLFPATATQDMPQLSSAPDEYAAPAKSDVSMMAASDDVSADAVNMETKPAVLTEAGTTSSYHMDADPVDQRAAAGANKAFAADSTNEADVSSGDGPETGTKGKGWILPDSLGEDVGNEDGSPDAASNEADDGGRSEPGDWQALSDDDFSRKSLDADITADYEVV